MTGVYLIFENDTEYEKWNAEQAKITIEGKRWGRAVPIPKDSAVASKKLGAMVKKSEAFK